MTKKEIELLKKENELLNPPSNTHPYPRVPLPYKNPTSARQHTNKVSIWEPYRDMFNQLHQKHLNYIKK